MPDHWRKTAQDAEYGDIEVDPLPCLCGEQLCGCFPFIRSYSRHLLVVLNVATCCLLLPNLVRKGLNPYMMVDARMLGGGCIFFVAEKEIPVWKCFERRVKGDPVAVISSP
jgi:hypothetical protein